MDDLIGMTFGPYDIIERIGEGGMAVVYKGYQASLNRHVAIKVLRGELAHDKEFIARFRQEALAAANLDHPNILHVYDAGMAHGRYYMAMAFVEGGSLKDLIRKGPLDVNQTVSIVAQLADALDHAHHHGLVHRDVKPSNVLMARDGRPQLTDFGIAKALYEAAQLTRTGATLGTPEYMAPEQAQGGRPDGRTDIYALGVVLYEMLTGSVPFSSDTPVATMYMQVHLPPPPLRRETGSIPPWLEEIVNKALAKDPGDRYQRAGEFAAALRQRRDAGIPAAMAAAAVVTPAAAGSGIPGDAGPTLMSPAAGPRPTPAAAGPTAAPAAAGPRLTPATAVPAVEQPRRKPLIPILIGAIALLVVAMGVAAALLLSDGGRAGGESTATDVVLYQIVTPGPTDIVVYQVVTPVPPATDAPTDAPTGVPTDVPTSAPTEVPTETPAPAATFTPLPPPTSTPTRAPTAVSTRTPTRAPSPTKPPVKPANTATKAATQFSAPKLSSPADGSKFAVGDKIVLSWQSVGNLPADGYYEIVVAYSPASDPSQTWHDETPWTKETRWTLSEHSYLPGLSADGKFRWSVRVMRKTGQNAQGRPTGTALSPMSATRTLTWGGTVPGGGGPNPPPTRTPLP